MQNHPSLFKKILVPVEFSDCSTIAAKYAEAFARKLGSEITLINVWHPPPFSPAETLVIAPGEGRLTLWEHVKAQATRELSTVLSKAAEHGVRIADRRIEYGNPAEVIVDVARAGQFDLIIMGTHGRTGIKHVALGSVAERVLRQAHCPVITVPCREHPRTP